MDSGAPSLTSSQLSVSSEAPRDTGTPKTNLQGRSRPKLTLLETSQDKPNFYCTICKCHLKLRMDFQAHLRGKRHIENKCLKEKGEQTKPVGSGDEMLPGIKFTEENTPLDASLVALPMDKPEELKLFCVPCRLALDNELNKRCHEATPTHLLRIDNINNKLNEGAKQGKELCQTCFKLIPAASQPSHVDTEDHIKNAMYRMAPCEICSIKYNDLEGLRAHQKTERHREGLAKIEKIRHDDAKLLEYFTKNANSATVKRQAFCLLCTTILGSLENLEFHNILNEEHHEKQKERASHCGPNKFWCYVCLQAVDEVERRIHAKRDFHKKNKQHKSKFVCEDCNNSKFETEHALTSHFNAPTHQKSLSRRKFLTEYYKNLHAQALPKHQTRAIAKLLELQPILAEVPAREDPLVEAAIQAQECSKETHTMDSDKATPRQKVSGIIPVAGDFCQLCDKFSPLDESYASLCEHIRLARGYAAPKPKQKEVPQTKKRPAEHLAVERQPKKSKKKPNVWAKQMNELHESIASGEEIKLETTVELPGDPELPVDAEIAQTNAVDPEEQAVAAGDGKEEETEEKMGEEMQVDEPKENVEEGLERDEPMEERNGGDAEERDGGAVEKKVAEEELQK